MVKSRCPIDPDWYAWPLHPEQNNNYNGDGDGDGMSFTIVSMCRWCRCRCQGDGDGVENHMWTYHRLLMLIARSNGLGHTLKHQQKNVCNQGACVCVCVCLWSMWGKHSHLEFQSGSEFEMVKSRCHIDWYAWLLHPEQNNNCNGDGNGVIQRRWGWDVVHYCFDVPVMSMPKEMVMVLKLICGLTTEAPVCVPVITKGNCFCSSGAVMDLDTL